MGVIDEVKLKTDILDLVGGHTTLKRTGSSVKGLCPFHGEKTPSFTVDPGRGTWRCFGACNEGGSVIDFVMKADNIPFPEALRRLAERAGVKYGKSSPETRAAGSRRQRIEHINGVAAGWFGAMLEAQAGRGARDYLTSRGIDAATAAKYGIGYAPGDALNLRDKLRAERLERDGRQAHLLVDAADGQTRDFFRNRITFQIHDPKGVVIGFGGRTMEEGGGPKYINSPDTELFTKSSVLYGLDWALPAIRKLKRAVVVEGYMDVVTAHRNGFGNVIATMGVALTEQHLELLLNPLRGVDAAADGELVLCLDSDAAGQEATLQLVELAWGVANSNRIAIRVARLSGSKDPDDLIRESPREWVAAIDASAPALDYLMEAYCARFDVSTPRGKSQVVGKVYPLLSTIRDDFAREERIARLAKLLEVDAGRLRSLGRRVDAPPQRKQPARAGREGFIETTAWEAAAIGRGGPLHAENHLLGLLLSLEGDRAIGREIPGELWSDELNRQLFALWRDGELDDRLGDLPPECAERVAEVRELAARPPRSGAESDLYREINECTNRLRDRRLRREMVDAAQSGDTGPERELLELHRAHEESQRR